MALKTKEIDSPINMRLYSLTKNKFVFVFTTFCIFYLITIIIGIAGPSSISEKVQTAKEISVPQKKFQTGPFLLSSGDLTQFNQQLWLFCTFQLTGLPHTKGFELIRDFYITVQLMGSSKDTSYRLISHAYQNRTRHLKCDRNDCESIVIFHLGHLNYPSYHVNTTFYGLHLPGKVKIRNVLFTFKYYNDQFTQIQIWFRFVFLVLSFTVTCMFAHSLREFSVRDWCIEQKWMSVLLPLLLLYNDPLFPLNFLLKSWVPGFLDALFQSTFMAALLMFWLCVYHGIRTNERRFLTFYLPKLSLVGLIWISEVVITCWQKVNELRDPSYHYKVDTGHFLGLKIFFLLIGIIYVIYLVVLLYQAYKELRNMPYFDVRVKFLTALMLLVVLISIIAVGLRTGTSILEENFILEVSVAYKNSVEFLSFYGLFNLYLYTMAYVYSPNKASLKHGRNMAESTFSMLAESDDEIMFSRKEALKQKNQMVQEYTSDEDMR